LTKSAGLKNLLCILASGKKRKKLEINFVYCVLRTPNRRLLSRKTEFEFVRPYDLIPKYAEKCERSPAFGGASEQTLSPENLKCLDWSGWRDLNPRPHRPERCALPTALQPAILGIFINVFNGIV
jgi:hypothetical protein